MHGHNFLRQHFHSTLDTPFGYTKGKRTKISLRLVVFCLLLTACAARPDPTAAPRPTQSETATVLPTPTPQPMDMIETVAAAGNLETITTALQAADLVEKLKSAGPFTLFAPTDEAFAALDPALLDDPARFFDLLLYHIVAGRLPTATLINGAAFTTLLGDDLTITVTSTVTGTDSLVNDARLITPGVVATNGVVHIIDKVLLPPIAATAGAAPTPLLTINAVLEADSRFASLVSALKATGVYTELAGTGPFTVLAPVQQAFAALPASLAESLSAGTDVGKRILHFHLIAGKQVPSTALRNEQVERTQEGSDLLFTIQKGALFAGEAKIIETDLQAANGVIHVIDTVLVPPFD